jgi:hypothetical protein
MRLILFFLAGDDFDYEIRHRQDCGEQSPYLLHPASPPFIGFPLLARLSESLNNS